jgi:hypothetical protein
MFFSFKLYHLNRFYINKQFDLPSKRFNNEKIESKIRFKRRLAFFLWSLFILFWSYCILAFIKIKFYVLLVCIFHLILDTFANGLIDFVCQLDANYRQHEQKRTTLPIKQD